MRIVEWVRRRSNLRVILGVVVGAPFLAATAICTEALVRARLDDEFFVSPSQIYGAVGADASQFCSDFLSD